MDRETLHGVTNNVDKAISAEFDQIHVKSLEPNSNVRNKSFAEVLISESEWQKHENKVDSSKVGSFQSREKVIRSKSSVKLLITKITDNISMVDL